MFDISAHSSLHEPAVADNERLAGQRICPEAGKEQGHFGHVLNGSEGVINRTAEHDRLDNVVFADPEFLACWGICFATNGVFTKPGHITLARTPCSAPSLEITRARPRRPCLAVT